MEGFVNGLKCFDCQHCFKKSPLFSLLDSDELELLNNDRMEASYKAGEIIYKQGTPLTHLVIIHDGFGKIFIEGVNGRNLILHYTQLLDVYGGIGVFIDKRHYSSLMAITDCDTCFIDVNAFKTVLNNNQLFRDAYLKEYSMRVQHVYNQFAVLTQKNMEGRMAESILYLKDEVFHNGSIKDIPKQDLAELTAMTKESAIRVLKDFKDEGHIEINGKTISILDKKALQQIALRG
jgi:CRP-like cAMP-binding protein